MPDLLADLRFALRRWTKRRTFAITAILTLALGIGAAIAIFTVVNSALLRPLPWKAVDRLVAVWVARPQWRNHPALAAYWDRGDLSWPMFQGLQEKGRTLETVGTSGVSQLVLGGAQNELVDSLKVSASFLPMLGTQRHLGRFFGDEEDDVKLPHLVALDRDQRGESQRPLWMLMAAAVGLLLIACANVGGLLLGEARVRRHEIAVRTAVGGTKSRLVRQLMVEALALASVGGLLGLAIARFLTPLLLALSPLGLPRVEVVGVDLPVLGFAVLLTIATALLFGVGHR